MRRTLVNIGNLGGGGVLTSLVLAVSFLFAANANADYVLTSIDPNNAGGFTKLFDIAIQSRTIANGGPYISDAPDGVVPGESLPFTGFGSDPGTGLTLTLNLKDLGVQYLSFADSGTYTYYSKPFSVNGDVVLNGAGAFGGAYDLTYGNFAAADLFYLTGLESPETITLHFGLSGVSALYTIGVYGTLPPSSAPEPATMLMFGLGIAGVAVARRIRRK